MVQENGIAGEPEEAMPAVAAEQLEVAEDDKERVAEDGDLVVANSGSGDAADENNLAAPPAAAEEAVDEQVAVESEAADENNFVAPPVAEEAPEVVEADVTTTAVAAAPSPAEEYEEDSKSSEEAKAASADEEEPVAGAKAEVANPQPEAVALENVASVDSAEGQQQNDERINVPTSEEVQPAADTEDASPETEAATIETAEIPDVQKSFSNERSVASAEAAHEADTSSAEIVENVPPEPEGPATFQEDEGQGIAPVTADNGEILEPEDEEIDTENADLTADEADKSPTLEISAPVETHTSSAGELLASTINTTSSGEGGNYGTPKENLPSSPVEEAPPATPDAAGAGEDVAAELQPSKPTQETERTEAAALPERREEPPTPLEALANSDRTETPETPLPVVVAASSPPPQPAVSGTSQAEMDSRIKDRLARGRSRVTRPGAAPGIAHVSQPGAIAEPPQQPVMHGAPSPGTGFSPRREEPTGRSMTQEQRDQALKASLRSTAPAAHGVGFQASPPPQPVAMTQEQKDQEIKARLRSTAPVSHGASYQPAPGAQSTRFRRPTRRQQQNQTQADQDAEAKARARAGYPVEGPPVERGAQHYGPPVVTGSVEASTPGANLSQEQKDRMIKAQAAGPGRQAEQDAIARSRARRGVTVGGPALVPAASTAVIGRDDEGLSELERRREQRAAARAERRNNRDDPPQQSVSLAPKPGVFANMNDDERQRRYDVKMAQMNQSHADSREKRGIAPEPIEPSEPQRMTPSSASTRFSNMSEEERQRRFDAKMSQMDQNHADRREKMGQSNQINPAQEQPRISPRDYGPGVPKSEEFRDEPDQFPPMQSAITTTADRGVAVAPDVEYGEYTQPLVPDDELAVAIAIDDEEEEEEEKFYAYAVEYDPDSKPPIYQNRRFRLYGIGGACVLVILVIVLVLGLKGEPAPPPIIYTDSPTDSPTEAPTTALENIFRSFFAKEVSGQVYIPGTPHYRAAEWIMKEDPLMLLPDDTRLLQRYMMAFLYFHTTRNGETRWRSCNPPAEGEEDTCVHQQFTRLDNDTITFVPKPDKIRWLSGQPVCRWEGVLCAGGDQVLGFTLFGQQLTGTLPTEIAALPFLQQISLAYNSLEGTIPSEYASLRHLLALELHGNLLDGSIPEEFYEQDSSSLVLFNVGDNMLSGTLDTRIGLMTDLKGLHIFENNFAGTFPTEISNLNYLSFTRFNGNEFEGTLPTVLGRLAQLSELWANENIFTQTIPSEIGNLRRLKDLRLWGNRMEGKIPDQIYNMRKLTRLSVREMSLTGTLSTLVGQLTELMILRVSTNKLTGAIPSEIQNLRGLRLAWLHLNQFNSSLPDVICENVGEGKLEFLQTDCAPLDNPPNPCRCCSACCNREDGICLLREDF